MPTVPADNRSITSARIRSLAAKVPCARMTSNMIERPASMASLPLTVRRRPT